MNNGINTIKKNPASKPVKKFAQTQFICFYEYCWEIAGYIDKTIRPSLFPTNIEMGDKIIARIMQKTYYTIGNYPKAHKKAVKGQFARLLVEYRFFIEEDLTALIKPKNPRVVKFEKVIDRSLRALMVLTSDIKTMPELQSFI